VSRNTTRLLIAAFVLLSSGTTGRAEQLAVTLSQEQIREAIELASDEKAATKFLQAYVLQSRSGMGSGPLIGYMSTPYARLVLAARAAKKDGKAFSAADVAPDLVSPELQVIMLNQSAAYDAATSVAQVVTVVRGTPPATVEPIRRATATDDHYRLYAVSRDNAGALVLSFPLDVVVQGSQIRVAYSHVVRGSSAITYCKDCLVPIGAARLR
jgi:hypothetical protein